MTLLRVDHLARRQIFHPGTSYSRDIAVSNDAAYCCVNWSIPPQLFSEMESGDTEEDDDIWEWWKRRHGRDSSTSQANHYGCEGRRWRRRLGIGIGWLMTQRHAQYSQGRCRPIGFLLFPWRMVSRPRHWHRMYKSWWRSVYWWLISFSYTCSRIPN